MSVKKIISILDKLLNWAEDAKKKFREWNNRRRSKGIRSDIDNKRVGRVRRRIKSILKKRQDRADSA